MNVDDEKGRYTPLFEQGKLLMKLLDSRFSGSEFVGRKLGGSEWFGGIRRARSAASRSALARQR